jgi:hypothetical protein
MWAPGQIEGMRVGGVSAEAEEATEPHSQRKATAVRSKTQSPAKAAVSLWAVSLYPPHTSAKAEETPANRPAFQGRQGGGGGHGQGLAA